MPAPTVPSPDPKSLSGALKRNVRVLEDRRRRDAAQAGWGDRAAGAVTRFTGSMTFVWLHLVLFGCWIVINLGVLPILPRFDPSFVVLAMVASVEAIFLSTFVLISQNRMAAAADARADLDLQINLLTEHELTRLARMVTHIGEHFGIAPPDPDAAAEISRNVAPEAVLDEIETRQSEDRKPSV